MSSLGNFRSVALALTPFCMHIFSPFKTVTLPLLLYFTSTCSLAPSWWRRVGVFDQSYIPKRYITLSWLYTSTICWQRDPRADFSLEVWENLLWPLDIGLMLISLPLCAQSVALTAFFIKKQIMLPIEVVSLSWPFIWLIQAFCCEQVKGRDLSN